MSNNKCNIIGASHAGVSLAMQLRREGWSHEIELISDELELPYTHQIRCWKNQRGAGDVKRDRGVQTAPGDVRRFRKCIVSFAHYKLYHIEQNVSDVVVSYSHI